MKAVIICGGLRPSLSLIKSEIEESDLLICADSGANCLYEYNILPDYLVGDFDSIDEVVLKYFSNKECKIERFPRDKDFTDSQLAVKRAKEMGVEEIVLLGCSGSRLDHTLGNIGLLKECAEMNIKASLKDENNCLTITDKPIELVSRIGQIFSLQAYCDCVENLTIKGAKYKLNNYNLKLGDSRTISNEFLSNRVNIEFTSGLLLVILSND